MTNIKPSKLMPGDLIGIISPSGPVRDMDKYDKGKDFLEKLGYRTLEGKHALTRWYHMSANGKDKADDINMMFINPDVKAIFPTLGGHTANQVLDFLDWETIRKNPKIFLGFSDSSALINAIYSATGLVCFHSLADIVFGFGDFDQSKFQTKGKYTIENLFNTLSGRSAVGTIPQLSPWIVLRNGESEGHLIGGNLSTLRSLIGTKYEPNWNGAILFLEDSAEPHTWDQQLGHLHLAGILNCIKGLVIGKVERPEKFYPENYQVLSDIFLRYIEGHNYPVLYSADFGHNVENCTLPIGIKVKINGTEGTVSLLESAVKQ